MYVHLRSVHCTFSLHGICISISDRFGVMWGPDGNLRTSCPTSKAIVSQGRLILGQIAHAWQDVSSTAEDCSVIDRFSLKQLLRPLKSHRQSCWTDSCRRDFGFRQVGM